MNIDIRWEQRFFNFYKALNKLTEAINYIEQNFEADKTEDIVKGEIIKEGLIHRFEYTHELAWKVIKYYAEYQGNPNVGGSRDAAREAYQLDLISNAHVWMEMIVSRNKTSHTYNQDTADGIFENILNKYYKAFLELQNNMESKKQNS